MDAWDIRRMKERAAIRAARKCKDCGESIATRGGCAKLCKKCAAIRHSYAANREVRKATSRKRNSKPERIAYLKLWHAENPRDRTEYKKNYDMKNRDKHKAKQFLNREAIAAKRALARMAKYGVPEEDRQRLMEQKTCDCCGVIAIACAPRFTRALVVDHDHATGKFRGMLCVHCNCMVGYAKEDAARLRAGANYVERNQNIKAAA